MPLFSVIIPVHNRPQYVLASVNSVLRQTFKDYEIIIVDDGSTDDTPAALATLAGRVKVIRQNQSGPGAARNRGIAEAAGQYIALLDSDDLWLPWTLTTYYLAIQAHDEPSFIASIEFPFRDEQDLAKLRESSFDVTTHEDYFASYADSRWIPLCGVAIKAEALRRIGGFSEVRRNFEETDVWLRLGDAPRFVRIESPRCSGRRLHDTMITADLGRNFAGVSHLIEQEKAGAYPGGAERQRQRLEMVTRHVRPVSLELLRHGRANEAWNLFHACFAWHVTLGRYRYLAGFMAMAIGHDWFRIRR
ncbi:MAG: glycosyltransferase family 2 protein [Phycisphaeraceae bacterium]|nr:glycosyltransferase family 2 protein [Phycisphaeraceae bacterium]